jgi:nitrogen fixation protein NifU and related proteins
MIGEELRDLYQEIILDHGKHPRNHRHPEDATHEARGDNPMCGDRVTVYLKVSPDRVIEDAAFQGRGCAISQASASMMTELVQGRTAAEAEALFERFHDLCTGEEHGHEPGHQDGRAAVAPEDLEQLQVMSGVRQFPMRVKCATLAWHAMRSALGGKGRASSEGDEGLE